MLRGKRVFVPVVCVTLATACGGAPQHEDDGALRAAFDLSAPGEPASDPCVATGRSGAAIFVWGRFDGSHVRVQTRPVSAAGRLGPIQTLSAAGQAAADHKVVVDDHGDAVFVWRRHDGSAFRVQTRSRTSDGALSDIQTLSPEGVEVFPPDVAVDRDGDAGYAWEFLGPSNYQVQARTRTRSGSLSPAQTLSDTGVDAFPPQVAVDDDGDAVFVWAVLDGGDSRIQVRARSATGVLSKVRTLTPKGENATDPQVAVAPDGDAIFTWLRTTGSEEQVQAQSRSAAGSFGPVQTLSSAGRASEPHVGVDADGNAVFVWTTSIDGSSRIETRSRSAEGRLTRAQTVSDGGAAADLGRVAVSDEGGAAFTWRAAVADGARIQTRARNVTGTLGAVKTLSAPGRAATDPCVAVSAEGVGVFAWQRPDGTVERVQGAVGTS